MNLALVPTAIWAMLLSLLKGDTHALLQLVLNLYLCVIGVIMLVIETRIELTRRAAVHLMRYGAAMMHPTARGVLYLLVSLTLLTQDSALLWVTGYVVELVGA